MSPKESPGVSRSHKKSQVMPKSYPLGVSRNPLDSQGIPKSPKVSPGFPKGPKESQGIFWTPKESP